MLKLEPDFEDPKTFAYAGFWAIIPKLAFSCLLALMAAMAMKQVAAFFVTFMMFYPFVALIVDLVLYAHREWIWRPLPESVHIPATWNISPSELLEYAQNLPKARLMRALTSPVLMILFIEKWDLLAVFIGFVFGFFGSVLFDACWLAFFKIKKPKLFAIMPNLINPPQTYARHRLHAEKSMISDREACMMEQMDPTVPGTPAYIATHDETPFRSGTSTWMTESHSMMSDTSTNFSRHWEP